MATTITMNECLRERCKSAKTINKVSEFLNRDMPTQLKNDFDNGDTRGSLESKRGRAMQRLLHVMVHQNDNLNRKAFILPQTNI